MDLVPTITTSMPPPAISSPATERQMSVQANGDSENNTNGGNGNTSSTAVGAAAAAQQPKIVQTAFIHKLYK
jgi:hypothetical protein